MLQLLKPVHPKAHALRVGKPLQCEPDTLQLGKSPHSNCKPSIAKNIYIFIYVTVKKIFKLDTVNMVYISFDFGGSLGPGYENWCSVEQDQNFI